jgi:hypothetical protein
MRSEVWVECVPEWEELGVRPKARPTPLLFVSIESKRLRYCVSLLFAMLAGRLVSVAAEGLTGGGVLARE